MNWLTSQFQITAVVSGTPEGKQDQLITGCFCLTSPSCFLFLFVKKKYIFRNKVKHGSFYFVWIPSELWSFASDWLELPNTGRVKQLCRCWIYTSIFGNQPIDVAFGCVLWSVPQEKTLIICSVAEQSAFFRRGTLSLELRWAIRNKEERGRELTRTPDHCYFLHCWSLDMTGKERDKNPIFSSLHFG